MNHKCKYPNHQKKHRDFSKKMVLRFSLFIIIGLILSNFIILSFVWTMRFYEESKELNLKIAEIENQLNHFEKEQTFEFLQNLSYEGYYLKILDEKNSLIFDSLTKYSEASKNELVEKHQKFLKKDRYININNKEFQIIIQKNLNDDRKTFAHFGFIFVVMNFFVVGFGFRFTKKLTYKTLIPINDIIKTAENITASDLSVRVAVAPNNDEIGRLGKVINDMMDRLENSFIAQNKFVSDASHELKTPLQIIKGYSELLSSWGINDEKVRDEALGAIQEEILSMTRLIEKLLMLAKLDNNTLDYEKDYVDLTELIAKVSAGINLVYPSIKINLTLNDSGFFMCNRELIKQALVAVIDNASKYSYGKGDVDISLNDEKNFITLIVKDYGIGIDSKSLDKVFDRFYRVDESRTKETGGTGLGLAIVKNIIEIHKGSINIESQPNKGTSIIIKLPKI